MENCDVLIVGAGPAGSTCARKLREAGLDVVLLDRQRFPRDKVCAGWITPAVVEALALDPAAYRSGGRVLEPIHGFYTGVRGGGGVWTEYSETVSYGIRRCEFDHYLAERAGARFLQGEALTTLDRVAGGWVANEHIRARLLIGAGGHFCPVARRLGNPVGDLRGVVAAKEVEFPLDAALKAQCAVRPGVPELYFCEDLKGYGWCLVKGGVLNIGLGREDRQRLGEHLESFVAYLQRIGRIPKAIPRRFQGHAYLLYGQHRPRTIVDDRVLLLGDAAGLAYPQSGEGIRPAVESGLIAAEVVLDAGGDYGRGELQAYEQALVERFGRREAPPARDGWLPPRLQRRFAARLLTLPWFTRRFVLDRWFLHRHQPALDTRHIALPQPL